MSKAHVAWLFLGTLVGTALTALVLLAWRTPSALERLDQRDAQEQHLNRLDAAVSNLHAALRRVEQSPRRDAEVTTRPPDRAEIVEGGEIELVTERLEAISHELALLKEAMSGIRRSALGTTVLCHLCQTAAFRDSYRRASSRSSKCHGGAAV